MFSWKPFNDEGYLTEVEAFIADGVNEATEDHSFEV